MMKQVMIAGDATATKQEIDLRLQLEEENVKWLQDRVKQSSELTSGGFWSSFKARMKVN